MRNMKDSMEVLRTEAVGTGGSTARHGARVNCFYDISVPAFVAVSQPHQSTRMSSLPLYCSVVL